MVALVVVRRRWPTVRRFARHLDRQFPALQDSCELLLVSSRRLNAVAQLQRQRTEETLLALANDGHLGPPHGSVRRAAAAGLLATAVIALAVQFGPRLLPGNVPGSINELPLLVRSAQIDERPASYTGRPSRSVRTADIDSLEFSTLRWTLSLQGRPGDVAIEFEDGGRVALYSAGDGRWQSDWWPAAATTYRVVADGRTLPVAGRSVHRVALQFDAPPTVRIQSPEARVVSVQDPGPEPLSVAVTVADDFGVTALQVVATRPEGDGEHVTFATETLDWTARIDDSRASTVRQQLDLVALGAAPGRELYITFAARDSRPDKAQETRSTALVVRWDRQDQRPDIVLDNQVVAVEAEYFRSQRQIIIDTEALLEQRPELGLAAVAQRAQNLAFDERALRMRYGLFMGEEVSGEPVAGGPAHYPGDGHDHSPGDFATADGHYPGDGHNHADEDFTQPASPTGNFGDVMAAIAPYAHFHDQEEQGTLFDPETRDLLAQALRAMWAAEGALRMTNLEASLPHQYRALALIKRVQSRNRVFAERVGFTPTPVDVSRRFAGELDEIPAQRSLPERPPGSDARGGAYVDWQEVLAGGNRSATARERVRDWLGARAETARRAQDSVALRLVLDATAVLDTWAADPACADCREQLEHAARELLPPPVAVPERRVTRPGLFAGTADTPE